MMIVGAPAGVDLAQIPRRRAPCGRHPIVRAIASAPCESQDRDCHIYPLEKVHCTIIPYCAVARLRSKTYCATAAIPASRSRVPPNGGIGAGYFFGLTTPLRLTLSISANAPEICSH
jgi:hypothetical protein